MAFQEYEADHIIAFTSKFNCPLPTKVMTNKQTKKLVKNSLESDVCLSLNYPYSLTIHHFSPFLDTTLSFSKHSSALPMYSISFPISSVPTSPLRILAPTKMWFPLCCALRSPKDRDHSLICFPMRLHANLSQPWQHYSIAINLFVCLAILWVPPHRQE